MLYVHLSYILNKNFSFLIDIVFENDEEDEDEEKRAISKCKIHFLYFLLHLV